MKAFLFILALLMPSMAQAAHDHPEKWYQEKWCGEYGGVVEHVLEDRTRVDCLLDEFAIEFDFGPKWAEAIGQSLYYSARTGRRPGIVLILEKPGHAKYLDRIEEVNQTFGLNLTIWAVDNGGKSP